MSKYYFIHKEDETCSDIEAVKDFMRYNKMTELEVFEAKREIGSDFFFCRDAWEVGEKGECGNLCDSYKPRNNKNGICKHNAPVYEIGKKINIKLKQ